MSVQPKRWTFAALTGRIPPFFMVRRRRRWRETVLAIRDLEGLVGVTPGGQFFGLEERSTMMLRPVMRNLPNKGE